MSLVRCNDSIVSARLSSVIDADAVGWVAACEDFNMCIADGGQGLPC